jgi:hypothetical protein
MAGLGAKLFTDGSVLNAAQVNGYLMDQSIMRFATTVARDAAFGGVGEATLAEGMTCYIDADKSIYTYDGSNWVKMVSASTPPALEYVASGTLSLTTTPTNVTGVFSSAYKNYRLLLNVTARSTSNRFDMKLIIGTTPVSSAYYSGGIASDFATNAALYFQRSNNDPQIYLNTTGGLSSYSMDIYNPNKSATTMLHGTVTGAAYSYAWGAWQDGNNACTGFQLFSSTGTVTIEYQVFGYKD